MQDFSFQGKVYLGTRLAGGLPGRLRWVGDAPKCDVSMTTESENRKESFSGLRMTSARLRKGNEATIAMTLHWASAENLALGLYGASATVAAAAVTNESLPPGLVAGDLIVLARGGVSSLVITDSTPGTPLTLVAGTHYRLDSANGGVVNILNVTGRVQPFRAAYSHTASTDVAMFTVAPPERYLLLDGINTFDNSPVRVRLYRVQFDPAANIPLINEGYGSLELTGSVLFDSASALDISLGGFGKIELPAAVA